ncbi:MAG: hypothetical protein RL642_142 [Bacteroidota bacterium]
MQPLPYCVYVLFSEKDRQLYTGYTGNIEKRIEAHKAGKNTSTRYRLLLHLVFCEYYMLKTDAQRREMYLKTTAGKRAIKIMLKNTLEKMEYRHPLQNMG